MIRTSWHHPDSTNPRTIPLHTLEVWTFLQSKENSDLDGFLPNLAPGYFGFPAPWPKKTCRMPRKHCSLKCYFGINHSRGPISLQVQVVLHSNQVSWKEQEHCSFRLKTLSGCQCLHVTETAAEAAVLLLLVPTSKKANLLPIVPFSFKITHSACPSPHLIHANKFYSQDSTS